MHVFHKQESLEFRHNMSSFFFPPCFRLGQQLSLTFCVLFFMSLASGYLFSSVVFHFSHPLLFCPGAFLFAQFTCCSSSHAHQPLIQFFFSFSSHVLLSSSSFCLFVGMDVSGYYSPTLLTFQHRPKIKSPSHLFSFFFLRSISISVVTNK